jgi:hypothetical protein
MCETHCLSATAVVQFLFFSFFVGKPKTSRLGFGFPHNLRSPCSPSPRRASGGALNSGAKRLLLSSPCYSYTFILNFSCSCLFSFPRNKIRSTKVKEAFSSVQIHLGCSTARKLAHLQLRNTLCSCARRIVCLLRRCSVSFFFFFRRETKNLGARFWLPSQLTVALFPVAEASVGGRLR